MKADINQEDSLIHQQYIVKLVKADQSKQNKNDLRELINVWQPKSKNAQPEAQHTTNHQMETHLGINGLTLQTTAKAIKTKGLRRKHLYHVRYLDGTETTSKIKRSRRWNVGDPREK